MSETEKNNYIDLHMHSRFSDDGEFEPEELVRRCKEAGVRIMAIADHNSVRGVERARKEAERLGIRYITAAEFDCTYKDINLHVVGYGIDVSDPIFSTLEQDVLMQERKCSRQKLELTNEMGYELSEDQMNLLSENGVYTGEMFAEVLLNDPRYLEDERLRPYRAGGARSDNPYVNFYWDYYAQGKPCYTEIRYPSAETIIAIIRSRGGVSVLAHPGNNLRGRYEVFDELVSRGLAGVEAFSSYHTPEATAYFLNRGRELELLVTCGSDYHGKTKPAIFLGKTGCTIDEQEIEMQLEEHYLV